MIAVLAGGVGAARLLEGLVEVIEPSECCVIVNTGDDANIHGLHVSPDIDTIVYTLAGASNHQTGWGLSGESWRVMESLERFDAPTWFRLGDRDLATHLFRTGRLAEGATISEVTAEITDAWGLSLRILPMSDDRVRTRIELVAGPQVEFQEYFVKMGHDVDVKSVSFSGASSARPGPRVLEALKDASVIVIAPSNPLVSIAPILAVPGIAEALIARRQHVVAISPIVGGVALKGPADRLLRELGHESSATGVARILSPYAGTFVLDQRDATLASDVQALGLRPVIADTVMARPGIAAALSVVALQSVESLGLMT